MKISPILAGMIALSVSLSAVQVRAETVISPRTKAEHEAEMRELAKKYAPKLDPELEQQLKASGGVLPSKSGGGATGDIDPLTQIDARRQAESAAMAAIGGKQKPAPGTKVRADLLAQGADQFVFAEKSYRRDALLPVLIELGKLYNLDHIVLLSGNDPIQLSHLVELSKLSESLKVPALYQLGDQLRAVKTTR